MLDPERITDRDSLQAWLESWPRETEEQQETARRVAVTLAHRAAMRVLPLAWHYYDFDDRARKREVTAIVILRCDLISGVARKMPTPEIINAADAATAATATAATANAAAAAADAATAAALATAAATANAADAAAAATAAATAAAYAAATDAVWEAIRKDAAALAEEENLFAAALWPAANPLLNEWDTLQVRLASDDRTDWSFWIDWYEDALAGREPNWPLLEDIALQPDDFWQGSSAEVNARIAEIQGEYAKAASPNAEEITRNDAGQFVAKPTTDLPPSALKNAIERAEDAIAKIRACEPSGNMSLADLLDNELEEVADYLMRYRDNPLRLYEVFTDTLLSIDGKLREGELPGRDRDVESFRRQMDRCAMDILNDDPEVERVIRRRASVRFNRLNDGEKARLHALTEEAAKESEETLAAELTEDTAVALDPSADDTEKQARSRYRVGSRLTRMGQIKREDVVRTADDAAKINKGVQAVGSAWDFLTTVYSWFT